MQLVVRVSPEVADELRLGHGTGTASRLRELVSAAGAELLAQHPGTSDPVLRRWFGAVVADVEAADRLAAELLELPGVDAAYVKPAEVSATPDPASPA